MDPCACLIDAGWAILQHKQEIASTHLDDYVKWRGKGGYEPDMAGMDGDKYHWKLISQYENRFGPYLDARLPER